MKTFWRVFAVAFLCFAIIFSSIVWAFNKFMKEEDGKHLPAVVADGEDEHFDDNINEEEMDELVKLVKDSKRVNMVLLGLDGPRSDMMMFASFDPEEKLLDIISIPRDTYYPRKGYDRADQKKINAAYGAHGAKGVKTVLSDLLFDVPVDYYVTITYKGVESIVDSIGGVTVTIPGLMQYDDPYSDPPLHIYFKKGTYNLKGADSVKFLRYRQSNKGSGAIDRNGDLGRIKAQQQFIESAMKKILGPKLPNAVGAAFRHVKTDIELQDAMRYATSAAGLKMENINMHTLPGKAEYRGGGAYFFHDAKATKDLLIDIYSNGKIRQSQEEDQKQNKEQDEEKDNQDNKKENNRGNTKTSNDKKLKIEDSNK